MKTLNQFIKETNSSAERGTLAHFKHQVSGLRSALRKHMRGGEAKDLDHHTAELEHYGKDVPEHAAEGGSMSSKEIRHWHSSLTSK